MYQPVHYNEGESVFNLQSFMDCAGIASGSSSGDIRNHHSEHESDHVRDRTSLSKRIDNQSSAPFNVPTTISNGPCASLPTSSFSRNNLEDNSTSNITTTNNSKNSIIINRNDDTATVGDHDDNDNSDKHDCGSEITDQLAVFADFINGVKYGYNNRDIRERELNHPIDHQQQAHHQSVMRNNNPNSNADKTQNQNQNHEYGPISLSQSNQDNNHHHHHQHHHSLHQLQSSSHRSSRSQMTTSSNNNNNKHHEHHQNPSTSTTSSSSSFTSTSSNNNTDNTDQLGDNGVPMNSSSSSNYWSQHPPFPIQIKTETESMYMKNDEDQMDGSYPVAFSMNSDHVNRCDASSICTDDPSMADHRDSYDDIRFPSPSNSLTSQGVRSSSGKSSKRMLDKNSDEYRRRRERNNLAVRKSREKAKRKSRDTERRVIELERDNKDLRERVETLRVQLNVLKRALAKFGVQADTVVQTIKENLDATEYAQDFLNF
ncbi:uncharacterized protein LOC141854937 [Brevipalpus obovatus]|uniref:uncharacterized protein LOC141854937 n=1 Tax=Brevipalpus obovatus TaxID=246614 RepID=UPI003D9E7925